MNSRAGKDARTGYTAVEMLIVVGIVALLATLAVPSLLGSLRNGRVNDACNSVTRVASQARQLARLRYDATKYYGVLIINDAPNQVAYVAMTYGANCPPQKTDIVTKDGSTYDELTNPDKAVSKMVFNRNVLPYDDLPLPGTPMSPNKGWLYQYRTGYPIITASPTAKPTSILNISMRTLDGKYRSALAVYEVGIANVANF